MNLKKICCVFAFVSSVAFAQGSGETVSLSITSSSHCGAYGAEFYRTDRGPEGTLNPVNTPFVVPAGLRLEVTDLTYELQNLSDPGYSQQITLTARDRNTGVAFDAVYHKHSFVMRYEADSAGIYRQDQSFLTGYGTAHVSWNSGLQVSSRARLCVQLPANGRVYNVRARGRLVAAPPGGALPVSNSGSTLSLAP
jgi:hypothetical protein